MYGTPVLGANIGGIPELIEVGKTGALFESGNEQQMTEKIKQMWDDRALLEVYSENCLQAQYLLIEQYTNKVFGLN